MSELFGVVKPGSLGSFYGGPRWLFDTHIGEFQVTVVFGNLYSRIRKLIQLYSETNKGIFGNLYSETYVRKLIQLHSETNVSGLYSETYNIRKLIQLYSETNAQK